MIWKPGYKGAKAELGFWKYQWGNFHHGGNLPVYQVIPPNISKKTDYYLQDKFMKNLKNALDRKSKESDELQAEINAFRTKSNERYFKLKKQLGKLGLQTSSGSDEED